MISLVFYIVILLQVVIAALFFILKARKESIFTICSAFVSVILLAIFEIKPHYGLRMIYGIPNTVFYIISLILLSAFYWFFRRFIMQNQYVFLIVTAFLWMISGFIDLLSDKGLFNSAGDSVEAVLLFAGSISYLIFYVIILFQNQLIKRIYNKYE